MAVSKKKVKKLEVPHDNSIGQYNNPDQYYSDYPSWVFSSSDKNNWSIYDASVQKIFWKEILPHFEGLEKQKWGDILINSKKQNHSINVKDLSKLAIDRLFELFIEAEALISLRITGRHRVYGYIENTSFHVLWVDLEHGDNNACVCQSRKKHT